MADRTGGRAHRRGGAPAAGAGPARAPRSIRRPAPGERFALLGECLLAGVLTLLAALPLVTLLAAASAGCAHVRAHASAEGRARVVDFAARLRAAWPGSWPASLAGAALAALVAADLVIVRAGLPGAPAVLAACAAVALAAGVVGLRAAAAWRPGTTWPGLLRAAARRARADIGGTALLAAALVAAAVATWALPPLLVPMAGCLLLGGVAVDHATPGPDRPPEPR